MINEETGYAYLVGTRTCSGGLHMVDIRNPKNPEFVGCYSEGGYTHDSECVIYKGLDTRYVGKEICFNYNEDELVIADVTDKSNVITISRTGYNDDQYTHQGWLTEDHTTLLMNDELDELYGNNPHTRTLIWSVFDLENPINTGNYFAENTVIDHNLYIKGNLGYLSNYCDGLRVFDVSAIKSANIQEKAFYDINPSCDTREFSGTWSNFPYFPSGNVIVSSIERGLFVVKVNKEVEAAADARKAQIDEMYAKGFSHSQVNEAVGLDSHIVHTQDFMMTMEAGDFLMIPSGYIVVDFVPAADNNKLESCCSGMRWSFFRDIEDDMVALQASVDAMVASWPALASTDFSKLSSKLELLKSSTPDL